MPGEAVLLNGQATYVSSSKPIATTTTKDDATSLYAHGGHVCRLSWHDAQPVGDCPTCGDAQSTCNTDDSEVCFTEELVRRKLLLGRCPSLLAAEQQYDRVPVSGASAEVVMRTFKGLPPPQPSGPCPPGTACWTSLQPVTERGGAVERVRTQ